MDFLTHVSLATNLAWGDAHQGMAMQNVLKLTVPRMKSLTPVMQANKMVGEIDYEANLRALYYDLAGAHSPEVIRMMLTITTPDHLLYGSDYPYVASQVLTQSLARMKQYLSTEPDLAPFREMILYKKSNELFK